MVDYANPSTYIIATSLWLVAFTAFLIIFKPQKNKKLAFMLILIPVVLSSFYLAGNTIYKNIISETGGPVHWHADYEVHLCGENIDLINPDFPSNKVGSPEYHEHDDNRIHMEGTPLTVDEVNLGNFFKLIGGELTDNSIKYPAVDGFYEYSNGQSCEGESDGNLKVYVNGKLIDNPSEYVFYPDPNVPPGDCIVFLFDDSNSETTDILCSSWEVNGWNYDSYKRRTVTIGDHTWQ